MIHSSALTPDKREELWLLVDRLYSGTLTTSERDRLESLIAEDEAAVEYCAFYADMHAALRWRFRPLAPETPVSTALETVPVMEASIPAQVPGASARFPSMRPGGVFGHVVSDWSVAYLFSAVICGIGILIAAFTHVSHSPHIVYSDSPLRSSPSSASTVVGRVTGMVDCVSEKGLGMKKGLGIRDWGLEEGSVDRVQGTRFKVQGSRSEEENSPLSPLPSPLVRLGDQIALASGLLEITYETGAKVILQGPVTYEVDSAESGFLAKGKLTARVEKRGEGGEGSRIKVQGSKEVASDNHQSTINNQQSSCPSLPTTHYPLFTITTPTAIVTDLGTEFGVEVSEEGSTVSHVFQGSVRIQPFVNSHAIGAGQVLSENQSALVANPTLGQESDGSAIRPITVDPTRFVRDIRSRKPANFGKNMSSQVVAWYRLGEDDGGAVAGSVVEKTFDHRMTYPLMPRTKPTYSANAAPIDSSLSVNFRGGENECLVGDRTPYALIDDFILEAWVCARKMEDHYQFVVYNGDPNCNGYGLFLGKGHWQFLLGGIEWYDSGIPCELGRWTHLALVCDQGTLQLWIDGRPAGEPKEASPFMPERGFSIGCDHTTNPPFSFNGEIDEVRLSRLSTSFRPEMLLFTPTSEKGEKGMQ